MKTVFSESGDFQQIQSKALNGNFQAHRPS
jgi:hypothetical protein